MREPWFIDANVAASCSANSDGAITLVKARTLSITTQVTFGGSIDADAIVYLYYSPDGRNWDTYAFTSWAITFDTSATEQITKIVNVPEHGYIQARITNGSSADVLTDVNMWYSIQSWEKGTGADRGSVRKDTGED